MLTRRVVYLALLACLLTTTALGMQPQRLGSLCFEQETEADTPSEESDEEEIEVDVGILVRRRAVLCLAAGVPQLAMCDRPRFLGMPELISCHPGALAARNGFGGPLRL